jgi:polysaccharide pyruvyl transferase WcaK-like protein
VSHNDNHQLDSVRASAAGGPSKRIVFFGHFGAGNFGNEATFKAMLWNVRRLFPDADLTCISTFAEKVASEYHLKAIPVSESLVKPWGFRNPLLKLARKVAVGIPSELYRWLTAIWSLRYAKMMIVVGTGLLNDSFSLGGWGPYSVFKWSVAAKLSGCNLYFVSAGAGPLDRPIGRFLVKSALSLAKFRSYRDEATADYLEGIGLRAALDPVFPDLAFSLPPPAEVQNRTRSQSRPVVGVGVMEFGALYGVEKTTECQYEVYVKTLAGFVSYLVQRGYDIRLLTGDLSDQPALEQFRSHLKEHSVPEDRVIAELITSTENLLSQIAATDFVVATRYHNVLLSLLLNKPAIAVSFHHKCSALMSQMGLTEYCQDIQRLNGEKLIEQFSQLEKNSAELKEVIAARCADFRRQLDEQYNIIFKDWLPSNEANATVEENQRDNARPPVPNLARAASVRKTL